MKKALLAAVVASSVMLLRAPSARAADEDPVAAQAETLRRANDKFDAGDYEGAIALYENILRTLGERRAMKVLFNLGLAYDKSGDVTSAVARYDAFLEACGREPFPTPELLQRQREAEARRAALVSTHGAIHVTTSRSTPAFFRLAGGAVRPAGATIWVVPGDHVVELDTGTPEQHAVHVLVVKGRVAEIEIDASKPATSAPVAAPSARPPASERPLPPPATERRFPTVPLLVGASATVVAGIAPLLFGLEAASKRDGAENAGVGSPEYPGLRDDYGDARTRYYVSFAIPGVVALASAVWVVLSASSSSTPRARD